MAKALSRVDLDVIYLDETFRNKQFDSYDDIKELSWFPIAELLETYSDSPNLRLIIIKSASDLKFEPDDINDRKYHVIQEMIASFDDEATLIITADNSIFEDRYGDINMRPLPDDNRNIITYVYENAAGIYVLDNMYKGEETDDIQS